MSLFWSFWLKRKTKHMALDGIIIKRMPKLQLSGLDIVHDIIPIGIPSLHIISQHTRLSFSSVFFTILDESGTLYCVRAMNYDNTSISNTHHWLTTYGSRKDYKYHRIVTPFYFVMPKFRRLIFLFSGCRLCSLMDAKISNLPSAELQGLSWIQSALQLSFNAAL